MTPQSLKTELGKFIAPANMEDVLRIISGNIPALYIIRYGMNISSREPDANVAVEIAKWISEITGVPYEVITQADKLNRWENFAFSLWVFMCAFSLKMSVNQLRITFGFKRKTRYTISYFKDTVDELLLFPKRNPEKTRIVKTVFKRWETYCETH